MPKSLFERMGELASAALVPGPDAVVDLDKIKLVDNRHPGISEAEARALNRQWRPLVFWLESRTLAQLESADLDGLAFKYAPIPRDQIDQMVQHRARALRRRK